MDVGVQVHGKFEVVHMSYVFYVQSSGCDICCYEDFDFSLFEVKDCFFSLVLAHVSVECYRSYPLLRKLVREALGQVFGFAEDEGEVSLFFVERMNKIGDFLVSSKSVIILGEWFFFSLGCDSDVARVGEEFSA